MNKAELLEYLKKLDRELSTPSTIYIYGSAVCILLDAPDRMSLDIDVAAPYSSTDYASFAEAAERAGLPVDPDETFTQNHIEWVQALRLCLPKPNPETEIILWQGRNITIKTGSPSDIVASKLIRYDETDQGDIQFLCANTKITYESVKDSVDRLPETFRTDALVLDNLENLKTDIQSWKS